MDVRVTLADLIRMSNVAGVERIIAHDDHAGCTVDIHNGVVDKYPIDRVTWARFQAYVKTGDGWKFTPSMCHRGFMASPVMTVAETDAATEAWNDRHPVEDYGLEARV